MTLTLLKPDWLVTAPFQGGEQGIIGLNIPPDLTPDEWELRLKTLWQLDRAGSWMLADLVKFAEDKQDEQWQRVLARAATLFGHHADKLKRVTAIARKFDHDRRVAQLTFDFYECVSSPEFKELKPKDADALLDRAAKEGWRVEELRAALRRKFADKPATQESVQVGFVPASWANEFCRWAKQNDNFSDWPSDRRVALKRELKEAFEIYEQL